jgi:hypothetical protein
VGSVVVIVITNCLSVGLVYLQSHRSFGALLKQRKIEFLSSSLNQFYNPLIALLHVNGEIFAKVGPSSFPEPHHEREAAAAVWAEMRKNILENNHEIEMIIRTKIHLISEADSFECCNELLLHVAMYEAFQKLPTDRYSGFQFPKAIRHHLA